MITCPNCSAANIEGADECDECGQSLSDLYLQAPASLVEQSLLNDRLGALNPKQPVTMPADTPTGDVLQTMVDSSIGCVILVDSAGHAAGIFTERDALLKLNEHAAEMLDRPVSEFMTSNLQTLQTTAKIAFAVHRMDLGGYRHIPIVDEQQQAVGIISVRDILRYLTERMTAAASDS